MYHVVRGKFGLVPVVSDCGGCHRKRLLRDAVAALTLRGRHLSLQSGGQRHPHRQRRLLSPPGATLPHQTRGMAMLVARILKGALKIRYLILGGAVGGGVTLQKSYQQWKDSLPDMSWIQSYLPDSERIDQFRGSMINFKDKVKEIEIDPRLKSIGQEKWHNFQEWLDMRISEAYQAAEQQRELASPAQNILRVYEFLEKLYQDAANEMKVNALPFSRESANQPKSPMDEVIGSFEVDRDIDSAKLFYSLRTIPIPYSDDDTEQQRIDLLQQEVMEIQLKYQKELEKLEKDNKELKKQLLLAKQHRGPNKTIKKTLIDMYSEVLDELADYDTSYSLHDQLPRVVVVGDQSAGKTSVLEMIAQARIFPRGAGEMMTRAPVKVTLSEGPYHVAQFKDSDREFDLSKEEDLANLRTEVELRMKRTLRKGMTVSNEVISMTVKGPGLQRMVLVDLPGIISTVTKDMAADTRECIRKMTEHHMANPNAIILCIQDGSVDAERSNVTDLVAQVDPSGKRTIFVLTKVDLAEENMADPQRIKKILSGKLFPMKALGYFAVVTGRGRKDETIQQIKQYEEQFFRSSKLFRDSVLSSGQVTTRNLSMAVSECFWKMVQETVEQQADAFKATRFNLETEWKNTFPRMRELDRDEMFEKARGEILDEVVNLSQVSAKDWESLLADKVWHRISSHVFDNIFLPAAQTGNSKSYNTMVDIRLKEWAELQLAERSIEAGTEALQQEFMRFMENSNKLSDPVFRPLKEAVLQEALRRHSWENKGNHMLRMIQMNALQDRNVTDKQQWDSAIKFLEKGLKERIETTDKVLKEMLGPSTKERWLYWRSTTEEQNKRNYVKNELEKLLYSNYTHEPVLNGDEITTVRKNLQRAGIDVSPEFVRETWHPIYKRHFLNNSLSNTYECRKAFYLYHQGGLESEIDCHDVVLFWRLERMLNITANALRQQVMNREARRLDKIIKEVLEDFSQDNEKKLQLLTGRRVTLAEELKRVRQIQEKLEEFIQALNQEK